MTNGLIFGKFAPLTEGHFKLISEALVHVDHLYLFLSFDQKFVDTQPFWMQPLLSLTHRLRALKDVVRDSSLEGKITVLYVDESNIPSYPEGAKAYEGLIREKLPSGVELTHAFSSEPEYESYFNTHFPECQHVVVDASREQVPISATKVRADPFGNFKYLSQYGRELFVKKVAIVGVESVGKSTMTKLLARHYQTQYVEEVGRRICEEEFHSSEQLMSRDDYLDITRIHRTEERDMVRGASVGVVFSDTTNLITQFSAYCAKKIDLFDPTFQALSDEEGDNFYDLVLYLQPDVTWVADPLRLQDTPEKRKETDHILDMMIRHSYNQTHVVKISGSDYEDRLSQAVTWVDKLIKNELAEIE